MNLRLVSLLVLLAMLPTLLACSSLGGGSRQARERAYYNEQMKVIQEQRDAFNKQQEEYNRQVAAGVQQWQEEYAKWVAQQQEEQRKLIEALRGVTENHTDNRS